MWVTQMTLKIASMHDYVIWGIGISLGDVPGNPLLIVTHIISLYYVIGIEIAFWSIKLCNVDFALLLWCVGMGRIRFMM